MHIMLKRTLIFLGLAIATGALGWCDVSQTLTKTLHGLSLLSIVLMMFCVVGYSLRASDSTE